MPSGEIEREAVLHHLQRLLESPGFARNERMSRFLRFVVERQLEVAEQLHRGCFILLAKAYRIEPQQTGVDLLRHRLLSGSV